MTRLPNKAKSPRKARRPSQPVTAGDAGICFEPLEPRLLLSGSWGTGAESPSPDAQASAPGVAGQHTVLAGQDTDCSGLQSSTNQNPLQIFRRVDVLAKAHALEVFSTGESWEEVDATVPLVDRPASVDATSHEVVFIDTGIQDYGQLADDFIANSAADRRIEIILLDTHSDGVAQISAALSQLQDIDAVHFVTHGSDGAVQLGDTQLSHDNIDAFAADIASWQQALTAEADILFYGCELAAGADGHALLGAMATLTGADVAASDDPTGSTMLGGDWDLEYTRGSVESGLPYATFMQARWTGLLGQITVTTTNDVVDGDADTSSLAALAIDPGSDGLISLREAVEAANTGADADQIILNSGTYTLLDGELEIKADLTITGADPRTTQVDGDAADRVFQISDNSTATLSGITIMNGDQSNSGGVFVNGGSTLNLSDAIVRDNVSNEGGGIHVHGTANLNRVLLYNNTASNQGGAIHFHGADGGSLTNVTISGNTATNEGGGLWTDSDITLTNVTIADNSAATQGGGLLVAGGTVDIANSIVADNSAGGVGPDVYGTLASSGSNLFESVAGISGLHASDVSAVDPLLGLSDNGGMLLTHEPTAVEAIDGADRSLMPNTDQRGFLRGDGSPDMGAYEVGASAASTAHYLDRFDTDGSFAGDDGSLSWSNNWQEIGESNGPASGDLRVFDNFNGDGGGNVELRISTNMSAWREADLSGAASATLSFDYARASLEADDHLVVYVQTAGMTGGDVIAGAPDTWDEIGRYSGIANDSTYLNDSIDISAYIAADTRIMFLAENATEGNDFIYLDNVRITLGNTATTRQETSGDVDHSQRAVAMAADGSYVVVWSSEGQDASGWGVYAQRFDNSGNALTGEILVNEIESGNEQWARVVSDSAGNFVVTWTSDHGGSNDVYARRFDSSGAALGAEFRVNTTAANAQQDSSIAMDASGNFIVVWEGDGTGDADGVFYRRFNADGTAMDAAERQANLSDVGTERDASVAMNAAGDFVVVWEEGGYIRFQMFASDGAPGAADNVYPSNTGASNPDVAMDALGNFVVVYRWSGSFGHGVWGHKFDSSGIEQGIWWRVGPGSNLEIKDHTNPSITMDGAGNFIVTYQTAEDGVSGVDITAERYQADTTSLGRFTVNPVTSGNQHMASVAMLDLDHYVVAYTGEDTGQTSVFVRQFGTAIAPTADPGGPYTIAEGDQLDLDASASADPDGTIVSWDWDIGDNGSFEKSGETVSYTWAELMAAGVIDDGMVDVTLRVTDNDGVESTQTFQVTVDNTAPTLTVSGNPTVDDGALYTLNLSTTDPGDDSMTWTISWGDGTVDNVAGSASTATHTYTGEGLTYNITVSASDEDGSYHDNQLLVADSNGDKIVRFAAGSNTVLGEFANGDLLSIDGAVIGPDGMLYAGSFGAGEIKRYDPSTGVRDASFLASDSLGQVAQMAFGPDGLLYVVNSNSNQILTYDTSLPSPTASVFIDDAGDVTNPMGLLFHPDGSIYVSGYASSNVVRYDASGNNPVEVANATDGISGSQFLALGPDGAVFIASTSNDRIYHYDGSAVRLFASGAGVDGPLGVALGPDGYLYVTSELSGTAEVFRYDTSNFVGSGYTPVAPEIYISSDLNNPRGITFIPSHQVTVNAVNDAPVLGNNNVTIVEGGTIIFDSSNLSATDVDDPDPGLTFTISGVTGGHFERVSTGLVMTVFTQADVNAGEVRFIHGGGETAPTYSVSVGDGTNTTTSVPANITFINQNDVPVANPGGPYTVDEDASIVLNGSGSSDVDSNVASYEWDLDYDGVTFDVDATTATPSFDAAGIEGPDSRTIALRVRDDSTSITVTRGATWAAPNGMTEEGFSEAWFARARNFDNGTPDFELGVGTEPGPVFQDNDQLTWGGNAVTQTATVTYSGGVGTITVGGTTSQFAFSGPFTDIYLQVKSGTADAAITVDNIRLDLGGGDVLIGSAGSVSVSSTGSMVESFLGIHNLAGTLSDGFTLTVDLTPSWVSPIGAAENLAFDVILANDPNFSPSGGAVSAVQTATVTIDPVNDAPTASGTYNFPGTDENTTTTAVQVSTIFADASIAANDMDGDTLGMAVFETGGLGTWQYSTNGVDGWTSFGTVGPNSALLLSESTWVRYVPDGMNAENPYFSFKAWDQTTASASVNGAREVDDTVPGGGTTAYSSGAASVSLTVSSINDAPVAVDDTVTATEDTVFTSTIDLDANDTDVDGDGLTVVAGTYTTAAGGTLVLAADGSYTYTPAANFNGIDTVDYTVTDGALTDTGTLTITVAAVNDAPVAVDDTITVDQGATITTLSGGATSVLFNDMDIDLPNDALSVALGTGPSFGSLILNADGTFSYTHDGSANLSDSFTYSVSDADGGVTDTGTVTITVNLLSLPPTATNLNAAETFTEDVSLDLADIVVTDVDSASVTVTLTMSDPAAGSLSTGTSGAVTATFSGGVWTASGLTADVNALLTDITFTPSANYDNMFTIGASVDDGVAAAATGVKIVTGTPVGDTPQVASTATPLNTLSNLIVIDRNPDDGAEVTHFRITGITNGTLFLADGTTPINAGDYITVAQGQAGVRFAPVADSLGSGSFTVASSEDGVSVAAQSGTATSVVTVIPPGSTTSVDPPAEIEAPAEPETDPAPEPPEPVEEPVEIPAEDVPEAALPPAAPAPAQPTAPPVSSVNSGRTPFLATTVRPASQEQGSDASVKDIVERLLDSTKQSLKDAADKGLQLLEQQARQYNLMAAKAYLNMTNTLDELKEEVTAENRTSAVYLGSAIASSVGLSVGYVVWLVRGGMLLTSLLSSIPAWQILDPLPVLAGRRRDDAADDDESLESMLARKPQEEPKKDKPSDRLSDAGGEG